MIDDPVTAAHLVAREVRTGSRAGQPTRIAVARRTYGTDQADLWDAVTNPERLPRWFLPVTGDLRPGGRYQLEGNAGGAVTGCHEPQSFAVTWEFGGMVSWLEVELAPEGDGTRLELRHEAPVDPVLWQRFGAGAVGLGWDLALLGLGLHVQGHGAAVDREAAEGFPLTPVGLAFVQAAAAGWNQASVADGDDPDQSQAAAEQSVAFYTTAPGPPPEG